MRFNISCETSIKCHIKVLKHLLLSYYHEKIRPENISFKINEMKCDASIYFFKKKSQFTLVMN